MKPVLYLSSWILLGAISSGRASGAETLLDLTEAVVFSPENVSGPEKYAIAMLVDEVEKRTQIRWMTSSEWPGPARPVIAVGSSSSLSTVAGRFAQELAREPGTAAPEGYRLKTMTAGPAPVVLVVGNDSRGVLFGVGHLLRNLHMTQRKIALQGNLSLTTAPRYALRGHQLGYRPKTNSYDGWTLAMWEQYIRDLIVFGTNTIELIPPRSDDDADSPHFPLNPMDTMIGMSRICDQYGLDVWIWYPALDQDYSDPKTVEFALNEWAEVFRKLPRIDAIFVPGGDPGHTQPKYLMALLEKQTQVLRRYHPKAQMWMAPQGFDQAWMNEFAEIIRKEPAWLSGIVYGPQTRLTLSQIRELVPKRYPLRHYPDITHSRHCQYPVPDWDTAFAVTEGREAINPRPTDQAAIFRLLQPLTVGFIAYSEGCNDDVNKIVWSGLGWNPDADVTDILRDYSRYFIGPAYADSFAQALLALERNWRGPVLTNGHIHSTLQQFQALEKAASPQVLLNWRFQQALYRAYYDAYVRNRLVNETALEDKAIAVLREASEGGSLPAMSQAEAVLDRVVTEPAASDWRARLFELAEALFQSIRMQLSVERYKAIAIGRGANLDTVDFPLNSRHWLKQRFEEIRRLGTETERLKKIDEITNWTNPGPGGFYDDLGNLTRQPHLVRGPGFAIDPGFFESSLPIVDRYERSPGTRMSWWDHAITLYDQPLQMHYADLDSNAPYKIRVVYGGGPIRLVAGERFEIHSFIEKTHEILEFDIPSDATARGELTLRWNRPPGAGGAGRGCQVAEVWLMRKR
jgi:hypothetical protein